MAEAAAVVEQQGAGSPAEESASGANVEAVKGGDKMSPGGNQWDGEKGEFVNPVARDEKGRFAKVRESLAKAKWSSEYVTAVQNGSIRHCEACPNELFARSFELISGTLLDAPSKEHPPPGDIPALAIHVIDTQN
jgi:hypothetical protein